MSELFSRPNNEAAIHDLEQYVLWTETPERPGFRSRLVFGERNGAPRITVFTNFENTKPLYVGIAPVEFEMFLEQLESITQGENGKALPIDNDDIAPNADRSPGKLPAHVVRNRLWTGKDAEGVCWIGVDQPNVKKIVFKLVPNGWHHFYKEGGAKLTEAEASQRYTRALIRSLRQAYSATNGRLRPPFDKSQNAKRPAAGQAASTDGSNLTTFSTFDNDVQF